MTGSVTRGPLTPWEATFLMVGAGVGAGIMAVPFLAERVGFGAVVLILVVAYAVSALTHLLLAEAMFRDGADLQVVELMRRYVFRGRLGLPLTWFVLITLGIAFLAALAAYVSASGEIVTKLTGLPARPAEALVYAVSAGVVFFGLGAVGAWERVGAIGLVACAALLAVGAAGAVSGLRWTPSGSMTDVLGLYGVVMFGYYTFFTVPQVVKGLSPDRPAAVRAILVGTAANGALMAVITAVALAVSPEVTAVAIVGIADGLGSWAGLVGSLFMLLALITSYWSMSLALADMITERTGRPTWVGWLIATLPSLLVLWLGVWQFLSWLRLAAGLTALAVAVLTIPLYVNAKRDGPNATPAWTLGWLGSTPVLVAVFLATVLMAIGALLGL